MKIISRLLIAVALLTTGSFALAAPGPADHNRRGQQSHQRSHDRQSNRHQDRRPNHNQQKNRRPTSSRHNNRQYGYRSSYRPARHHSNWRRGHRYYGPTYVVRDYGHYHLRQPPYGYHWVRSSNDYLLVAIATGIILDIALR